jgi:hypothetical protein
MTPSSRTGNRRGFYPWAVPGLGVRPSWHDYRWYRGGYFTPRSERIYGFTLPRGR